MDWSIDLEQSWLIDFRKTRHVVEQRTQTIPFEFSPEIASRTLPDWSRHVFDGLRHQTRDLALVNYPSLFTGRREFTTNRYYFGSLDWGLFLSVRAFPPPVFLGGTDMNLQGDPFDSNVFTLQGDGFVDGHRCAVVRRELLPGYGQADFDDFFVDEDAGCIIRRWYRYEGASIGVAMDIDYGKESGRWSPTGWTHSQYGAGQLSQAEHVKVTRWNPKARIMDAAFRQEIVPEVPKVAKSDKDYMATMGGQRPAPIEEVDEELERRRRTARPAPGTSRVGIGVVAVGLAVFYWWNRRRKRAL